MSAGVAGPRPRTGPAGAWDRFVGPGASRAENAGTVGFALLGAFLAPRWLRAREPGASAAELVAAAALALDIVGGAWTNATRTTRRWYGRDDASILERVAFPLIHVHPFLAEIASGRRRWIAATTLYAAMLGTSAAAAGAPRRARLAATGGIGLGLVATRLAGGSPRGWEWLPPAYLAKLAFHGVPA